METDNNAKSTNAEQPAFPLKEPLSDDTLGLTKREYFAAMAMQGLVANSEHRKSYKGGSYLMASEIYAEQAVSLADALLNQLNK